MLVPRPLSKLYERPYKRGLYGMIGDRYAEGLEAIMVVGDRLLDIDEFYAQTKERDGYPCLRKFGGEDRQGGAAAVAEMVRGLGVPAKLACDTMNYSVKTRIIVDNKVVCRLDQDHVGGQPHDLSPARLVLIADYNKGVVSEQTINRIAKQYKGREIIADWHPSKPAEFYHCATALKASWDCPDVTKPLIRTMGRAGILLQDGGDTDYKFHAKAGPVIDPCGAGDMVLATLGAGRVMGLTWRQCCEWATENAGLVCQHWGAVPVYSQPPKP